MRHPLHSLFCVVVRAELRFNSQRVAPYALAILFSVNAWLWWSSGPAIPYGWATNSDFYIARCMVGFVFLSSPFFVALLMGDAVLRDFRFEVHPLLLATPIRRVEYLLGKFCGNFLTLVLCSSCFALTLFLLQAFRAEKMLVLPWRTSLYLKHFLTLVVISHLFIAAYCFTIGTLTRSTKFVYLGILAGYVFFIFFGFVVSRYVPTWNAWLGLTGPVNHFAPTRSAEFVNQYVNVYGFEFLANRMGVIALAALLLAFLTWRFTQGNIDGAAVNPAANGFGFTTQPDRLSSESELAVETPIIEISVPRQAIAIPDVTIASSGARARWQQFIATMKAEFRLLRHERSLIALAPLVVLFASVELGATGNSISYAVNSAQALLLLLSASLFFYVGEAMHRDDELRVEAVLWSAPQPNWILLMARFAALILLAMSAMLIVMLVALLLQLYRGLTPLSVLPYFAVYGIVLLPSLLFVVGVTIALHVLLRNKYLAHVVGLGISGTMIWQWLRGYVNGLYNPVLYQLWTYEELVGNKLIYVLWHRAYWWAITIGCLAIAHWFYARRDHKQFALVVTIIAVTVALLCGWQLNTSSD